MDTKKISVIPVDEKTFADYNDTNLKKVIGKTNDEFAENLAPLFNAFQDKFKNKEWIYLTRAGQNEGVYYVNDIAGLMPDLDVHGCSAAYAYRPITYNDNNILSPSRLTFAGFQGVIPTSTEAKKLFNDQINYFRDGNGNIKVRGDTRSGLTIDSGNYYMFTNNGSNYRTNYYNSSDTSYFWVIPIFKFGMSNPSAQKVIWTWLEFDLSPTKFPSETARQMFSLLKKYKDFLKLQGDK